MQVWHEWRVTLTCRWDDLAKGERVAGITLGTSARRDVVDDGAQSVDTARPGAGIHALQVDAGLITRALRVYGALGSAIGRLAHHVVLQAGARGGTTDISALRETTTGGWYAGIFV